MSIGQRIRQRREELHLTQEELAKLLGYKSKSTINKVELGINDITQSKIQEYATALGTSPAYLMGWRSETDIPSYPGIAPIATKKFPLLGSIACGVPIFAHEELELYIEAGTDIKADFVLRCKGDSMIDARINDGDIVFIRKQPTVENGQIAAVVIGDEATLKRVYIDHEHGTITLVAANPKYAPMVFVASDAEQIIILGLAVAFQSDIT